MSKKLLSEQDCVFCSIVTAPSNASVVFEDRDSLCFLDTRPLFPGHCLLIPKPHIQTLMEMPEELLAPMFANARRLSVAVQTAMRSQGVFVAMNNVVSQSVPHLHVHIVPRNRGDGLKGFFWPRQHYQDAAHQEQVRSRIAAAVS
ncbi:MAG: HIT family protein [Candidatus Sumerlaeaceae bacterium]